MAIVKFVMVLVRLKNVVVFNSTFDEYAAEVRSGRLEWSPVHKSEKFWVRLIVAYVKLNLNIKRYIVCSNAVYF